MLRQQHLWIIAAYPFPYLFKLVDSSLDFSALRLQACGLRTLYYAAGEKKVNLKCIWGVSFFAYKWGK